MALCIGQLGRKKLYVFCRLVLKSCVMILMYLEDVTKSLIGLFSEVINVIVAR